jgi:hypothetical protein
MSHRKALGIAVCLALAAGCGRKRLPSARVDKVKDLTVADARKVFEDHVAERYGDSLRLLDWQAPTMVREIVQPENFRTLTITYVLECSSATDVTALMEYQGSIRTTDDPVKGVYYWTGGYEKTDSGYRIVNVPMERVICGAGQKISFSGELSFQKGTDAWIFLRQNPDSDLANPAPAPAAPAPTSISTAPASAVPAANPTKKVELKK